MSKLIYTNSKSAKQKKKPGWQKEQQEYNEWLKNINSMSCFAVKPKKVVLTEKKKEVKIVKQSSSKIEHGGTVKYIDPRVQYKDNPEMLQRELEARERKFTVAPVYNKGGDMLITDEMAKDIKLGLNRRR